MRIGIWFDCVRGIVRRCGVGVVGLLTDAFDQKRAGPLLLDE